MRKRRRSGLFIRMRIATFLLMSQDPKAIVRLKAPFPPPDVVVYRSQVRRCVVTAQGSSSTYVKLSRQYIDA